MRSQSEKRPDHVDLFIAEFEESRECCRTLPMLTCSGMFQVTPSIRRIELFQQQMGASTAGLNQAELQLMEFTRDEGVVSASMERDAALQS